jgi:pyruvate kinase
MNTPAKNQKPWLPENRAGDCRDRYRKTKIIATLGPSSREPERIRELIEAGANVFRLNFSHGSHEEHLKVLVSVRAIAKEMDKHVAILQDLSGPKIRISAVEGEYCPISDGQKIELRCADGSLTNAERIYVETLNPMKYLKVGHPILLADGILELVTEEVHADRVVCRVIKGGRLRSRVGIAFPDSAVDLPATTQKDLKDVQWGIANQVDYVAISFVRSAEDIHHLRKVIKEAGTDIGIVAKIERKAALEDISEIIKASDGLMIARGDLGLEVPLEQLPNLQRRLIEESNAAGVPVIVATQMMHSMITSVRPSRAEVSDVATAVMSGADAVMLSDETAIGEHPGECVRYLSKVSRAAEQSFIFDEYRLRLRQADTAQVPDAVAYAACAAAVKVSAQAVIACTATGRSVRLIAKYRPQQPLFGASDDERTLRRMALFWGVVPIKYNSGDTSDIELESALSTVQKMGELPNGALAVVTGGRRTRVPGATSVLEIREMRYL